MKELFNKFWYNKKLRDITILSLLIIIFIITLIIVLQPQNQNYSIKLLICKECRKPETRSYLNILTQKCNRCEQKAKMLYSFKCSKCDYEFGVRPIPQNELAGKSKKERTKINTYNKQCPNCQSLETFSLVDYEKLKSTIKKAKQEREAKKKKLPSAPVKSETAKKK